MIIQDHSRPPFRNYVESALEFEGARRGTGMTSRGMTSRGAAVFMIKINFHEDKVEVKIKCNVAKWLLQSLAEL